ncbi:bifunctional 4-hydroxy-2-oxoglutarate aldolase/2-dehydro-3-deoxy-phosphogluconate aldolase [Solibacillus sp. A46]|uniref:Bifunctional 4-hydroxy-2-oxoglutarate aldolase/2-dehydro-3-deoxy-phosphogluconate aldolase n=2 Tax=Solibacillus faecavium TaxID=2762221 RepID=A0ABR8XXD2_9BACL|nr:bifunctional 4-hydroxy-2-oxoglutarate aldolase/2-dehydro-3-deoxy-phosphogluconate aldolase [Solibacillus faecavium]
MMYNELKSAKLIPVLRKIPYETSQILIETLILGGVKAIEITMDTKNAPEIIREARQNFGDRVIVGAGTVLTLEECMLALDAGAQFIVSPSLNLAVVEHSLKNGIAVVPGVFTPTEMQTAYSAGAEMIKLFPASALSPSFIKDVKGPLSHISIMTTGGITINNAKTYLEAGASTVGAGSDLINKEMVKNEKWALLQKETERWVELLS